MKESLSALQQELDVLRTQHELSKLRRSLAELQGGALAAEALASQPPAPAPAPAPAPVLAGAAPASAPVRPASAALPVPAAAKLAPVVGPQSVMLSVDASFVSAAAPPPSGDSLSMRDLAGSMLSAGPRGHTRAASTGSMSDAFFDAPASLSNTLDIVPRPEHFSAPPLADEHTPLVSMRAPPPVEQPESTGCCSCRCTLL
jgi:hypothetical protein